ncbi:GAF domain-containing sensor histidine kinase [Actinopolymorpha singaporensis]|uniref:Histidine kinase-, DNA gyrase B-, and HSP90-like ATPase n=1 Tax=Actinopolymorpha singaporensis TaxID=117157 RepID=A0A1H1MAQ4_9ACTN|nr:sensor histidine kinase [Actinopolymorpha singaporensis]SDR83826.1 Histidine kinase-, DNA gyrase B-, and HSP90-like ATPase [Actinopolymorpha singaporensis]
MTGHALGLADAASENALLVGIIEAISAGPEPEVLAARVAPLIVAATDTDECFVHVLDDTEQSLTLAGATPPFDREVGRIRLRLGEGVTGWAASRREPVVIVEGKANDPRYRYFPELRGEEYTSMVSVPMASSPGGLVGVLNVHTRQRREFSEADVRLLTSIGSLIAGAVHQARLHRRLAARERAHERFAEQAVAAQEGERRRLAADIHDGITQRLCSLRFHLDAAAEALTEEPAFAAEQLVLSRRLTHLAIDEARAAINGLRPPVLDDLGLADSLASLARAVSGVDVLVEVDRCALPEHVEIALYRIAQEAFQNVVKHAGASNVRLSLRRSAAEVSLEVSDDGRGFDLLADGPPAATLGPDGGGYGLGSMAERAELIGGRLDVRSAPGRGTTVLARAAVQPQ